MKTIFQEAYSNVEDYESIEDIEQNTQVIRINDDAFIVRDF